MSIRHLRIFVAVATTGKMCDAADELFISQPTVSQAIKELEEYYGVLLFERLGRKLHITESGRELLFYARNLLDDFDSIEKKMFEVSSKKRISIGATITIGSCILPDIINELKSIHPNINTYSCISNTQTVEQKILNSELDIGLVEGNINNPSLISIPALTDSLVLACNSNHKFAEKDELSLKDIRNKDFILREQGSGTRKLFEEYINSHNVPINIVLESNCPGSIKKAIIKNNFFSVMSARLIAKEVLNGQISIFRCTNKKWDRNFNIVYHKDKFLDSTLEDLIYIFKNYKCKYDLSILPRKVLKA